MMEVNHEYYVSLEVAKLLKETGFDWGCCYCYEAETKDFLGDNEGEFNFNEGDDNDFYSAPTLAVAQRWLREVKGLEIFVGFTKHDIGNGNEKAYFYSCYEVPENEDAFEHFDDIYYHSYEEAQEAGIKKALEVILEKGE